MLFFC
jgi:hypothetical protein